MSVMKKSKNLLFIFLLWVAMLSAQQKQPISIGESSVIKSSFLKEERKVNVYLPIGYNPQDTLRYPVIYVLDGGMEEDFFHLAGVVQFSSQSWVGWIPQAIVVGVEGNTRRRDFTFAVPNLDFLEEDGFSKAQFPAYGGSENYMDFIEKELQPFVNKSYKTTKSATVIGESLAGLFTAEVLCKRPYLFENYMIISPSVWWGGRELLKEGKNLLNKNLKSRVNVYVGVPNREEYEPMYRDAEQLYELIKSTPNIQSLFDYMPDESHATVLHQAMYNAFKKFFSLKKD